MSYPPSVLNAVKGTDAIERVWEIYQKRIQEQIRRRPKLYTATLNGRKVKVTIPE